MTEKDNVGRHYSEGELRHLVATGAADEVIAAFDHQQDEKERAVVEASRVSAEKAYDQATSSMLRYVGLFKAGMIDVGMRLLEECEVNGEIDINMLNKRLAALKLSADVADKIEKRALGNTVKKVEQTGTISVEHKMAEYQKQLLSDEVIDVEPE